MLTSAIHFFTIALGFLDSSPSWTPCACEEIATDPPPILFTIDTQIEGCLLFGAFDYHCETEYDFGATSDLIFWNHQYHEIFSDGGFHLATTAGSARVYSSGEGLVEFDLHSELDLMLEYGVAGHLRDLKSTFATAVFVRGDLALPSTFINTRLGASLTVLEEDPDEVASASATFTALGDTISAPQDLSHNHVSYPIEFGPPITFPNWPVVQYRRAFSDSGGVKTHAQRKTCVINCSPEVVHLNPRSIGSIRTEVSVGDCNRLSTTELVDWNDPAFLSPQFNWENDTITLATAGRIVEGFAADGISTILVRTPRFQCPGQVCLSLFDTNEASPSQSGVTFSDQPDGGPNNPLTITLRKIPGVEQWIGFAWITPPADFVRSGANGSADEEVRMRPLKLKSSYYPAPPAIGACRVLPDETLQLVRPPVMLLHGLHDDGSSWNWPLRYDERFDAWAPPYPNDRDFRSNALYLRELVKTTVAAARQRDGMACTQIDIFGHSMGGVLARRYWLNLNQDYLRADNFFRGDFHKLITVNSPHLGSQAAPLLVGLDDVRTLAGFLSESLFSRNVTNGAVRDLRPDSTEINEINNASPVARVSAHLMISRAGSDFPYTGYWWEKAIPTALCYFGPAFLTILAISPELPFSILFVGDVHDCAVPLHSQSIAQGAASWIHELSGAKSQHYPVISDGTSEANMHAVALLNASISSPVFRNVITPSAVRLQLPAPCNYGQTLADWVPSLTGPFPNLALVSGQSFVVEADVQGTNVNFVGFTTSLGTIATATTSPFQASFTVPESFVGTLRIGAIATDDWYGLSQPTWVDVHVDAPAPLVDISVGPPEVTMSTFSPSFQLTIVGDFEDGVKRDITKEDAGTIYDSIDPSVAFVESDGLIRSGRPGFTNVVVNNSGVVRVVTVHVQGVRGDWDNDGGIGRIDVAAFVGCLTGPLTGVDYQTLACRDTFDWDIDLDIDLRDYAEMARKDAVGNFVNWDASSREVTIVVHNASRGVVQSRELVVDRPIMSANGVHSRELSVRRQSSENRGIVSRELAVSAGS